jgi:hypothetical protein
MATTSYEKQLTALLVVDPYNDYISQGSRVRAAFRSLRQSA